MRVKWGTLGRLGVVATRATQTYAAGAHIARPAEPVRRNRGNARKFGCTKPKGGIMLTKQSVLVGFALLVCSGPGHAAPVVAQGQLSPQFKSESGATMGPAPLVLARKAGRARSHSLPPSTGGSGMAEGSGSAGAAGGTGAGGGAAAGSGSGAAGGGGGAGGGGPLTQQAGRLWSITSALEGWPDPRLPGSTGRARSNRPQG
jgi:hypothetical protein